MRLGDWATAAPGGARRDADSQTLGETCGPASARLSAAALMRQEFPLPLFFGASAVRAYIKNQKEHHASGRIQDRLERVSMDDDGSPWDG